MQPTMLGHARTSAGHCVPCAQVVSAISSWIAPRETPFSLFSAGGQGQLGHGRDDCPLYNELTAPQVEVAECQLRSTDWLQMQWRLRQVGHQKVVDGNHFTSYWHRGYQMLFCRRECNFFKRTNLSTTKCLPRLQPLTSTPTTTQSCCQPSFGPWWCLQHASQASTCISWVSHSQFPNGEPTSLLNQIFSTVPPSAHQYHWYHTVARHVPRPVHLIPPLRLLWKKRAPFLRNKPISYWSSLWGLQRNSTWFPVLQSLDLPDKT